MTRARVLGGLVGAAIVAACLAAATRARATAATPAVLGDDSGPNAKPQVIIPERYRVRSEALTNSVSTSVGSTVYFTPQDENASTTVLSLFNTSDVDATVGLQSFGLDGTLTIDTSLMVPAHNLVRVCADTVSTVSATWTNVVLVNFTTFSTYAKLTLPPGVKVDGYVAWNTSGTYDPLAALQTLPIVFH